MITNNNFTYSGKQKIKTDDITEYVTHNFEDDDFKYTVEVEEDFTCIRYYDWNGETHKWEKHDELQLPSNMAYLIAQAIVKDVEAINGVIASSVTYRSTGIVDTNPCKTLSDPCSTPSDWTRNISTGDYPQAVYPTITTATTSKTPDTSTIKRA